MFDGYLSLAGQEIINSQRTGQYIRTLAPRLGLRADCCDCDTLETFFGDSYNSPLQDEPPWFAAYRPESAEFLGLLPLALQGFDDSTRTASITQLTGDGAVTSRPRLEGRELRVTALAVATSDKGLDYGMSWLRTALAGSGCSGENCNGDALCFLAACPDICDDDLLMDVVDEDYRFVQEGDAITALADYDTGAAKSTVLHGIVRSLHFDNTGGGAPVVSRTIRGLTPGAIYRLDFSAWYGDAPVIGTLVATDQSATAPMFVGPSLDPDNGIPNSGGTIEFTATDTSARLVLTTGLTTAGDVSEVLDLTSLSVTRINERTIVMAMNTTYAPSAWAWSATTVAGVSATVVARSTNGMTAAWTGSASVPAGGLKVSRTLTGMIPGRRYRVRIMLSPTTESGAVTSTAWRVSTNEGTTLSPDQNWVSTNTVWVTHEFIAQGQTTTLSVSNDQSWTMTSKTVELNIPYLRLEWDDLAALEPVVDPNRLLRTFRNVTVTSGPTVVETFDANGGVIQRVEWTMLAGSPRPLGEDVVVTTSLGPGTEVVPDIPCVNGLGVLHNLVTNPSFETGITGVTSPAGGNVSLTFTNPVNVAATSGSRVLLATVASTVAGSADARVALGAKTLSLRSWYTVAMDVRASKPSTLTFIGEEGPTFPLLANITRRVAWTFALPPNGSTTFNPTLAWRADDGLTAGQTLIIDSVSLVQRSYAPPYFDGSTLGGSWDGTPNASTSTWSNPAPAIVVDPNCPPIPSAPRPPAILNPCLPDPTQWTRHTLTIPAYLSQRAEVGYPIINLTTGDSDARGVRLRIYANPFNRDPAALDPCSYCGEFLLSYLPANASLEVDSATQEVTIVTDLGKQSGRHLLYGSDGAPMTWPEMACGVPYVLTVDLDTATSPLINLALSFTPGF